MAIKLISSEIHGTSNVNPYLTYNEIKRIISIFSGTSVVNPTIKNTVSFFASNIISGASNVTTNLDVDHLFHISTNISGNSIVNPDLLVGSVKTLHVNINGQGHLDPTGYNIQCISEGNTNLKLWGDELTSYTYGSLDYTSHIRGTFCFKGTPDSIHSPTLSLKLRNRTPLSDYDALRFFVKASSPNRNIKLSLYRWPYNTTYFNLDPYIEGGDLVTSWKLVKLPLSIIEANGNGWTRSQGIEHFKFGVADTSSSYSIYVDEIWAVDSSVIDEATAPFVGEFKSYQFTNTNIGSSNEQKIRIYNNGFSTLDICDIDITGVDSEDFVTFAPRISSAIPTRYVEIPVNFIPQSSGPKTASLVVRHSDTMLGDTSVVTIYGNAYGPEIQLDTTSIDFGTVADDNYLDWKLPVSNTGNQTLNIFDISSSSPDFSIVSYSSTIAPSQTSDIIVRFSNISTLVNISARTLTSFEMGVTKGFDANIFSAKSILSSDLFIDEYPFGTFIVNAGSSASFDLGVSYNLSLKLTNEILAFSIVEARLKTTSGLKSVRSYGSSSINPRMSVLKKVRSIYSGSTTPNLNLNVLSNSDLIISGHTQISSSLKVQRSMNLEIITSGSSNIELNPIYPDYSINIHGSSSVSIQMSEIRFDLTRKSHFPTPVVTFMRSHYPWQHNDVYSRDLRKIRLPQEAVYTTEEIDQLVINKATKTGETQHGNIALLRGSDGDLLDSGVHPNDLFIDVIDFGTF